jgi:hypothetical protein
MMFGQLEKKNMEGVMSHLKVLSSQLTRGLEKKYKKPQTAVRIASSLTKI